MDITHNLFALLRSDTKHGPPRGLLRALSRCDDPLSSSWVQRRRALPQRVRGQRRRPAGLRRRGRVPRAAAALRPADTVHQPPGLLRVLCAPHLSSCCLFTAQSPLPVLARSRVRVALPFANCLTESPRPRTPFPCAAACPAGTRGTGLTGCRAITTCAVDNGGCWQGDGLRQQCTDTANGSVCGGCPAGYDTAPGGCTLRRGCLVVRRSTNHHLHSRHLPHDTQRAIQGRLNESPLTPFPRRRHLGVVFLPLTAEPAAAGLGQPLLPRGALRRPEARRRPRGA